MKNYKTKYKWKYVLNDIEISKEKMDEHQFTDETHTAYKQNDDICFSIFNNKTMTATFYCYTK